MANTKSSNTKKESFLENLDHKPVQFILVYGLSISIAGIILWPIFDLIWSAVITHSEFVYSVKDYVLQPITFGFILAVVLYPTNRIFKSKSSDRKNG